MELSRALPLGCELKCRGCSHRGWETIQSERQKENWIRTQLSSWENLVSPIRGVQGSARWGYRKKTCLHAQWEGGFWKFGLLAPVEGKLREYEVIHIPHCPIHSELIQKFIHDLHSLLPPPNLFPLVFLAISGTLVTFVLKTNQFVNLPSLNWEKWGLTGVYLNLNPSAGKRVYYNRGWKWAWGSPRAIDSEFQYGPECFQQLIPELHHHALMEAAHFLNPEENSSVLDLYSGLGRSLSVWKQKRARYLGVELGGEAVQCAEINIGKGCILRGRVSERLPQLSEWLEAGIPSELLVYANPPRLGFESEVLDWITDFAKPSRIAYLSCSVGTLKRDLLALEKSGYGVQRIIPYDFFPQTHHVETLVLLSR